MKEYFKLELMHQKTYWKFYTSLPSEIYDWIKHFIQRGAKGFSDYDCWSVDNYLCQIIPDMLRQLKRDTHGFPADLTEEKWNEILDKIILGFEAANKLNSDENWEMNKGNEMVTTPHEKNPNLARISWTNPWTEEQIKHFRELDEKDKKIFDEGMELFHQFFFNLWD